MSAGDFSTDAATPLGAGSYAFSVVINESKTAKEWFNLMAFQCRCYFRFALGKAYLLWRPDSLTSDKTITDSMVALNSEGSSTLQVSRSLITEVINKISAQYKRNWVDGSYGGIYSISDATSIAKYGTKEQPSLFNFDFITVQAMAEDVGDFYLARYKDRKKIVTFQAFLDNCELEFADAITITPESSLLCEIMSVNFNPGSATDNRIDTITITAKEY
jgi:hypothetical protein